jgi:hypothetical protein
VTKSPPPSPTTAHGDEGLLIALMATLWVVVVAWHPRAALVDDVARFIEIASAGGKPYVAFPVEYPPLTTLLIRMIGGASPSIVAARVAALNAASTLGCWLILRSRWSRATGRYFLWFALPLQLFMPFRLDALTVMLTVGALALADADVQLIGGLTFAAAVLLRLWPATLLPGLYLRDRRKACVTAIVATLMGVGVWIAWAGLAALDQVSSYRGASGWHLESVYGVLTYLASGGDVVFEGGALRLGIASPWELMLTRIATVGLIAIIWARSRRRGDLMGRPALASVAALILLSPVSSPQFVVWLTPWAAIAAAEGSARDVVMLMTYLTIFAAATFLSYWGPDDVRLIVFMAGARALCLLGLVIVGVSRISQGAGVSSAVREEISR